MNQGKSQYDVQQKVDLVQMQMYLDLDVSNWLGEAPGGDSIEDRVHHSSE